jgi:heme oxygenase
MSLREAIKENHDKAEKHCFVELLLTSKLPKEAYAEYLFNQAICYYELEAKAEQHSLLDTIPEIKRAAFIKQDAEELGCNARVHCSTYDYIEHLKSVPSEQLWAHIYVRHFADMYGGQMIKRVAPGSCRMYEFEDRAGLITKVRQRLSDNLAEEANQVFGFALRLFDEVSDVYDLRAA